MLPVYSTRYCSDLFGFITLLLLASTSTYSSVSLLVLCSFAFHISFYPSSLDRFPFNSDYSDSHPAFRLARPLTLRFVDVGRPLVD